MNKRGRKDSDLHQVHQIAIPHRKELPDGFPRVLGEWAYSHGQTRGSMQSFICEEERMLQEVCAVLGLTGYFSIMCPRPPAKPRSQEQLARARQNKLRKHMESRYPLFADQFIADEIARFPDRYAGRSKEDLLAEKYQAEWQATYNRWVSLLDGNTPDFEEVPA